MHFIIGNQTLRKVLLPKRVPSLFAWTKQRNAVQERQRDNRAEKRQEMRDQTVSNDALILDCIEEEVVAESDESVDKEEMEVDNATGIKMKTEGTQTIRNQQKMTHLDFIDDPSGLHLFTGLETYAKFVFVLSTLSPACYRLTYKWGTVDRLVVEDKFLIFLIKLRQYWPNAILAKFFSTSEWTIGNIFSTWINFVYNHWKHINIWPSRDHIRFYMPKDFKQHYPTTRVILDGMEFPIRRPKIPCPNRLLTLHIKVETP